MLKINDHIKKQVPVAPLATFRVAFGFIMLISIFRFMYYGWIDEFYIQPNFHFSYYGFSWIKTLDATWMYAIFFTMALSAFMVMIGRFYRVFIVLFFLTFTYVELIDKTYYLNHYYFISLVSFIMIWLPAHRSFSFDVVINPVQEVSHVPSWVINVLKLQLFIVYFYAGLAKLNYDWLIEANPLSIWLPANSDLPIIGAMLKERWGAYAFSWSGAIYDLTIPFFLLYRRTRTPAFCIVVVFHMLTWWLFPIGMFPFIMILSTTIFFSATWHKKLQQKFLSILKRGKKDKETQIITYQSRPYPIILMGLFMLIQVLLPWRYLTYPDNLFWTEEGYRFSWRVMLMEKAGYATFHVTDLETGRAEDAYPTDYLTPLQEKMMSTQPDMILQFAHYLEEVYRQKGIANSEISVDSYVTLNGGGSRLFVDPAIDLLKYHDSFSHKRWVLPMEKDERTAYIDD